MLCPACGTDTPPPLDHCRHCATPLPPPPSGSSAAAEAAPPTLLAPSGVTESPLQIGEMFGRYRVIRLLGAGGMGQVYQAWDQELGEAVALKVIRREFAGNADADARFKRELSVARQVTHTNVVRIHDLGLMNGVRYISMPFIEGIDLGAMLNAGRLPQDVASSIARQLAAGLAAAHQAGVVHRDLKPGNVMVDRSGHVFLMDFGLARSMEVTQLTQAGMLVGTIEYMSPEQARGDPVDHRSDIYALGLILFELFTGERPFKGDTPMSRLTARLHRDAPDPRVDHPDVPAYMGRIILRCLERDPARRYQKVDDIIVDLDAHRAKARRLRTVSTRVRSSRVAAAVILAAALAFGGYLLVAGKARRPAGTTAVASHGPAVSLAIVPFQNASGDPSLDWLGASIAEMLGTGVGQSAAVRAVSLGRIQQVLRDLHLAPNAALDQATLRRVADFAAADTVLSGRYVRVGDQLRIDAVLDDLKHSRTTPLKEVAAPEKDVLRVVDDLARQVQAGVSASPDVLKELRASAFRPSSSSIDAIRGYSEGLQLMRQGDYERARQQFEAATKQDADFALARSELALALSALGHDDDAERASRRAVSLSAGLPARERYLILADHARVLHDDRKAIDAYENLAKVSADDPDVQFTLAQLYENAGALDKARDGYARVLKRDPKYVDALLALGRVEIKRGNTGAAVEPLNQGLGLAIQMDNAEEKGRILHAIGIAYTRMNKPDDALRYFEEALAVRRTVGQKSGTASTISEIAEVQRMLGRTRDALASYQEALAIQREIGDRRGVATNLLNLGSFLVDRGQYDEGLSMMRESLQADRDLGDVDGQAVCLNNIGRIYFSQARYDDALTYFQQALQLREALKVPGDIAETVHNLAECSLKMGHYDQALSQYLRALDLFRTAGDREGAAIESYATGKIFALQGRYAAALAAREEALKAFRAIGDRTYWMANILGGYGQALSQIARYTEADRAFEEGLQIARGLNNQALVAQLLNCQGDRFYYGGDYGRARPLYEQALRLASTTTDREQNLLSRFGLARLDLQENRADAAAAVKAVAAQADALGVKSVSLESSLCAGEALLKRHQNAQAKIALDATIAALEKAGVGSLMPSAHYLLGTALAGTGEHADAAREFAEARRLVEGIRKEAGTDAILARSDLAPILRGAPNTAVATTGK